MVTFLADSGVFLTKPVPNCYELRDKSIPMLPNIPFYQVKLRVGWLGEGNV